MLTLSNLSKRYGPKILFREVSLRMMRGEKMGLVGANGAGKTTLFSILLGEIDEDEGKIEWEKGNRIGYLPQESAPTGEETVLELATATTEELAQALKIIREDNDPASPQRLEAQEIFAEQEGYNLEAKAKKILSGLAFHQDDFNKPAHTLSGGWIMRAHLARLLVMEPDLLMLDEPTNHLDLETLGWFQAQVQKFSGSVLTISHDRAFLNSICNGIIEISNRKIHRYPGNFDNYLIQKKEREAQHLAAYRNQQREIAHHEDFIRRFRAKASKASQAQARIKTLEKMERIDPPEESDATINFTFPQPPRSGQRVATLNAVRQAYGDHLVYSNLNLEVEKHERIALVGPNGAGKSTLINETLYPILNAHIYRGVKKPMPYKKIEGLEHIDKVIDIDQSPIGRTPRSNPATYTGTFSEIRNLFAKTPEAAIRGYKPGRFSFNVKGGRCETCQGGGVRVIEMNFLPDVYVECETCQGKRFNRETLEIRYKGKSISDILNMTIEDASEFFKNIPKIHRKLKMIKDVGLGYITLGQRSTTLSGGEAQRIKLASELSKRDTGNTFYILDEPTTGLHFEDIRVLMEVLNKLANKGNTVLIIEHNLDVVKLADFIIDVGMEGGKKGGKILCKGTPEEVARHKTSYTAKFLKKELL